MSRMPPRWPGSLPMCEPGSESRSCTAIVCDLLRPSSWKSWSPQGCTITGGKCCEPLRLPAVCTDLSAFDRPGDNGACRLLPLEYLGYCAGRSKVRPDGWLSWCGRCSPLHRDPLLGGRRMGSPCCLPPAYSWLVGWPEASTCISFPTWVRFYVPHVRAMSRDISYWHVGYCTCKPSLACGPQRGAYTRTRTHTRTP